MADVWAVAVGRFYEDLAERLVSGATRVFEQAGGTVEVHDVPGPSSCRSRPSTAPTPAAMRESPALAP